MIELRTGVPGSGKTLSMVEALAKLFKRWAQFPDEARPVFVLGIPDLAFPVAEVPLRSVQINKAGAPSLVPDWDAMPSGSLVIIDEAQGVFPPRSSATAAPAHVAWLNTHRHHGFDIWLTTQHPKLIDGTVRALVGKHMHYRRLFGGMRAGVYEWDCCSDSLSGLKSAVFSYWPYPKQVFKWYKSAEIHTKQQFKLPLWLLIPVVGLVMLLIFVPKAYSIISNGGRVEHEAQASVPALAPRAPLAAVQAAQGGALAPPEAAPLRGFPSLDKVPAKAADASRSIAVLRIARGVYGDDKTEAAHWTDEERNRQAQAVAVLNVHEAQGRYVSTGGDPQELPPIYHDPTERYYGF